MYSRISSAFMPISDTGSASHTKAFSTSTASPTMACTVASSRRWSSSAYVAQAKSQCSPSSREINSLEKVSPGIKPRFLSQKMAQNEPLKKIPSTAANATKRCANDCRLRAAASRLSVSSVPIHRSAHAALARTAGTSVCAWNNVCFTSGSRMRVSMSNEYISWCTASMAI